MAKAGGTAGKMKRKWVKRSDVIILAMVILWFVAAVWGMVIVTIQVIQGSYNISVGEVLTFIGAPVAALSLHGL